MKTVEQAFSEQKTVIDLIASEAKAILSDFCNRKSFLLVSRTKDVVSIRDKVETGRYDNLSKIDDLVAFSVVIDTLSQEKEVRAFLSKAFNVELIRSGRTLQDERLFDFDCTRVYCRLIDSTGTGTVIASLVFEIQIRTLLQHAWSKITHSLVYKARVFDARASRLAAELMAHLETADRTFSRFKTESRGVKSVSRRNMAASNSITLMIDALVADGTIPVEMRPENGRRLGENIFNSIRSRDTKAQEGTAIVKAFLLSQREKFPRSLSLFQLAIIALHDADLLEHGSKTRKRNYYVTAELISLFPTAATIPNHVKIVFDYDANLTRT